MKKDSDNNNADGDSDSDESGAQAGYCEPEADIEEWMVTVVMVI